MTAQIGNDKIAKVIIGGEAFLNESEGWQTYTDDDPIGVLATNNFVYKINREEKYISIFMTGKPVTGTIYGMHSVFFDLSWLVTGMVSIDMSLPQLIQATQPEAVGQTIVSIHPHPTNEGNIGNFTKTDQIICAPLNYSEPRVYYSGLVGE